MPIAFSKSGLFFAGLLLAVSPVAGTVPLPSLDPGTVPAVMVVPAERFTDGGDLRVQAFAIHPLVTVDQVILRVRGERDSDYRAFRMEPDGAGGFTASIPAWATLGDSATYYATAADVNGGPLATNVTRAEPLVVKVMEATVTEAVTALPAAESRRGAAAITVFLILLCVGFVASLFRRASAEPNRSSGPLNSESGISLVELLVTVALLGLVVTITTTNLKPFQAPLRTGGELLEGSLKQARARAISTTESLRVVPNGATGLAVESAASCGAATWTAEPAMSVDLPDEVRLVGTSWSVCFNNRGIASDSLTLTLSHPDYGSRQLEVLRGGIMRWL